MKLSTRKAIRTGIQTTLAVLLGVASFGAVLIDSIRSQAQVPQWVVTFLGAVVVFATVVAKVWNAVEARWPGAGSWLLRGPMVSTDVNTGETVATPQASGVPTPRDGGYGLIEILGAVLLVVLIVWLVSKIA